MCQKCLLCVYSASSISKNIYILSGIDRPTYYLHFFLVAAVAITILKWIQWNLDYLDPDYPGLEMLQVAEVCTLNWVAAVQHS